MRFYFQFSCTLLALSNWVMCLKLVAELLLPLNFLITWVSPSILYSGLPNDDNTSIYINIPICLNRSNRSPSPIYCDVLFSMSVCKIVYCFCVLYLYLPSIFVAQWMFSADTLIDIQYRHYIYNTCMLNYFIYIYNIYIYMYIYIDIYIYIYI